MNQNIYIILCEFSTVVSESEKEESFVTRLIKEIGICRLMNVSGLGPLLGFCLLQVLMSLQLKQCVKLQILRFGFLGWSVAL